MAIFHLSMKVGRRGKSSAAAHAAYILREGQYSARITSGKERLEASGSGNLPSWAASDPLALWAASDAYERSNGSVYREMELALPRELTPDQRNELLQQFIQQEIGTKHAYSYGIHNKTADDGQEQPHAHVMWSERQNDNIERDAAEFFKRANKKDPSKGGAIKGWGNRAGQTLTAAERAADLVALRSRWADATNSALANAGREERVDSRSNLTRGIFYPREKKIGPLATPEQREHLRQQRAERANRANKNRPAAAATTRPTQPQPLQPTRGYVLARPILKTITSNDIWIRNQKEEMRLKREAELAAHDDAITAQQARREFDRMQRRTAQDVEREIDSWGL